MRRFIIILILFFLFALPVNAAEFTPPQVSDSGAAFMPDEPETFSEGLLWILKEAIAYIHPSLAKASGICLGLIAVVMILSLAQGMPNVPEKTLQLVGTVMVGTLMLQTTNTMIQLGAETVTELSAYGKLLIPVMTAAVAAQGGAVTSTAMYTATVLFDAVLCSLISAGIVQMVYAYLGLSVASSAVSGDILGKLRDFVKWLMTWSLKIVLYVFSGYMTITGIVSGSADASAIKAVKLTISGMVPVVGSILSDASETILISTGMMKNAVGVYGLLAIIAVWVGPFIQIGVQYLLLKATCAVCGVFGVKQPVKLMQDFTKAMGILLAMTSSICLLLLISTVCMMKGIG